VADLINEGTKLQHCVGKMGYDKKVVDGVSLIAFVRKNGEIEKPFVTAEYRFDEKKLRQCYGIKDSKPSDEVLAFVNTWAENVRKEAIHNGRR
jgi:NACalpha-BTF3-like transcription factor